MPNEGITKDENKLAPPTPPLPPPRGRVRVGGQLYLRVKNPRWKSLETHATAFSI